MNSNTSTNRRLEQAMRRTVDLMLEFLRAPQNLQPVPIPVKNDRRELPRTRR